MKMRNGYAVVADGKVKAYFDKEKAAQEAEETESEVLECNIEKELDIQQYMSKLIDDLGKLEEDGFYYTTDFDNVVEELRDIQDSARYILDAMGLEYEEQNYENEEAECREGYEGWRKRIWNYKN